ncbi:MAG: Gfo/Idh/MocA family oxidoreductase [Balneolales bacterium]
MKYKQNENTESPGGINRRDFFKGSAALGALSFITPVSRVFGANNRLRLAVCGVNGRGNGHLRDFANEDNVEIAWIIDPDKILLVQRGQETLERTGKMPKLSTDLRHALDDPDVDGIVVAAPNHWHSQMVIWAAQAGKHCFVEKPASHDFHEGRVALEASRKYGVVVQHGTQRRSDPRYANLINAIHSGKFGKLTVTHAFASKPRNGIGHAQVSEPPPSLDWNMWRGHAMIERYHKNFVHYNWHWFWDTGNGDLNNQGTHQLDVAFWSLDPEMHGVHPTRVMSMGGRFGWDDQGETPNTQFSLAEYPNGQKVIMNIRNVNYDGYERRVENRYYFEDGGQIIGDEYISPNGDKQPLDLETADIHPGGNIGSFVNACRAGDPNMVNAGMFEGHYSSALGHLMNISYRLGHEMPFSNDVINFNNTNEVVIQEQFNWFHGVMQDGVGLNRNNSKYRIGPWLTFDSESEKFVGELAANANTLLRNPRRSAFEIPEADKV